MNCRRENGPLAPVAITISSAKYIESIDTCILHEGSVSTGQGPGYILLSVCRDIV